MNRLLNSIICYNNSAEIVEYVKKLAKLNKSDLIAVSVVINDDSTNKSELEAQLKDLGVEFLVTKPAKNLGYLNGMVEGVKQYLLEYPNTIKWIIMSNTDITYPDANFIDKFFSKIYENDVWCVGPSVFVPHKNAFDNPVCIERRSLFNVNKIIIVHSIPFLRIIYQWASCLKTKLVKTEECESGYVYEVHGCYFIINIELYKKIVENPYKSFMYSEEAFIAETVYHNNKRIYFDSNLKVEHNEHSVTSTLKLAKISKLIASSMKDIKREFYQ